MAVSSNSASRRKLAIGLVLIALTATAAVVLFRTMDASPEKAAPATAPAASPAEGPRPAPIVPLAPPAPLGRADLLTAAAAAAAAYSAGQTDGLLQADLVGRPFRVSIPFGCFGPRDPAGGQASAYWEYGQDGKTLKISVGPQDWTQSTFLRGAEGTEVIDAVEGFWIPRPWLAAEACPAVRPDPSQPAAPAPETVGLAVFYAAEGSRVQRRNGRPYEVVVAAPGEGRPAAPQGYRLVLEGRVAGFPDGRALRCHSQSPDQRPVCVFRVEIDHVQIRDPAAPPADAVLGEWRS